MKNFQFSNFNFQIIAILCLLFVPFFVFATTAIVEVDTSGEEINAIEATLILPEDMYVKEIQTGNSAILIWVTPPEQIGNEIMFAGITPGGFNGVYPIFTINGDFTADDLREIQFKSVFALKNDGIGSITPVTLKLILSDIKDDKESPEDFTPIIASDPNIFDGKYFLVFVTQDKSSGVRHYEVREGKWGSYKKAESPYLLSSQKLDVDIYVKAIDNAGNEKVVKVSSLIHKNWWEWYKLFVILMVILFVVIFYKKLWAKFTQ